MRNRLAFAAAIATLMLASDVRAAEVRTITERLDEDVDSISVEGGRAVLKTARRTIDLKVVKQIRWNERAPLAAQENVILTNRDEVRGNVVPGAGVKDGFTLRSSALGSVNVTFESVAGIFFNVAPENERKLHAKHLAWLQAKDFAGRPNKDSVYIRTGGKAQGYVSKLADGGVELDMSEDNLGKQTFATKDIEVLVLGNAGGAAPTIPAGGALRVRVKCDDGSSISGEILGLAAGKLSIDTGKSGIGKVSVDVKNVLDLFVLNGSFEYLSDLDPTKVDQKFPPGLEFEVDQYGWRRDAAVVEGGQLRLGGRTYDKGLGVHSYCALTYQLGGGYREFRAVIGLDDVTKYKGYPGTGSVKFRVLLDGKPCKEFPDGKKKKKAEAPEEIAVDVGGVKELTIVVDYGDFLHILGRADWADAYLVKR
jgi:hypothetical protein